MITLLRTKLSNFANYVWTMFSPKQLDINNNPEPIEQKTKIIQIVCDPKKERKKRDSSKRHDFNELLDNLECTFESLKIPTMKKVSWIDYDTVVGLRKLGAHVPNPWLIEWSDKQEKIIVDTKHFPTLMFASIPIDNVDAHVGKLFPHFIFAVKHQKAPMYIQQSTGTIYQFGYAFYHKKTNKLVWAQMYLAIDDNGQIKILDELQEVVHRVPLKTPSSKRSHGTHITYTIKQWGKAYFLNDENHSPEVLTLQVCNSFRSLLNWWNQRDERWNVIIKKDNEKITFGVNDKDTPYYFKSRDRVVNENGKTKKIVHYCKEHERNVNGKVITIKQHIRGLRRFNWQGFDCHVVSPKLQQVTSASFVAAALDESDNDKKIVYLSKVGKVIGDMEDMNVRRFG